MAYTKLDAKAGKYEAKYVTPTEFAEQYSISKAQIYKILAMPELAPAIMKIGEKGIRVNQPYAFKIMQELWNDEVEEY